MLFLFGTLILFLILWAFFIPAGPLLQHGITALGHRTAALRYRDYFGVVVLLILGMLVTVAAGDEFFDLAELVQRESPLLQDLDKGVHNWAATERSPGATFFFTAMTHAGSPVAVTIVVVVAAGILVRRGRYRWAAYLAFANGTGALVNVFLKLLFERQRPDLAAALRSAHGYSFPSGHAMGATVVALSLSYLALRAHIPWLRKAAALAAATTFVVAVSLSRIYLGVHWISDIAAGMTAGALWVTVTTVAYEAIRRIRRIRSRRQSEAKAAA